MVAETIVGGELKTRLTMYVLLVILKTAHANRRSFTVPALAFVYSRGKVSDILSNHWHLRYDLWHDADCTFLLGRILPKDTNSALPVDVRLAQNIFAQVHYQNVEAFLPGFPSFAE